jgi:uncharacterized membrane protein
MADSHPRRRLDQPRSGRRFSVDIDPETFGRISERLARFLGTGTFLFWQTLIVIAWIVVNLLAVNYRWDPYPFILLNLAFSTQAAYAAPLILLAQTRQADRDKAHADADAQHREDLAQASFERQVLAEQQAAELKNLLEQNTRLTQLTQELTQRIKELTDEIHSRLTVA